MELRIKEILDEKGETLVSLQEKTGIEKGNLSAISNNKKNPTLETLSKIASSLGVEIWELFTPSSTKEELTALISYKNDLYQAKNLHELEKIVDKIKKEKE